ncbi:MAG: leucyl/phenylalanyl-tRNA--protein transferase [Deltaproteobacteria bacterium]|nr:leucyl/phenylalanyl-tRNA--protein transferase [Deltaproteobacteria bacterium]
MVERNFFPDPETANEAGVVCAGAKPTPALLTEAYQNGIFPWPHRGYPLLWFSPDPRFVLPPKEAHLHRSLKKAMRKTTITIKADTAFVDVIGHCSKSKRPGQRGTWITADMIAGYTALHREGFAHSIEAWEGDKLVGGLYGVSFGSVFFGESMFATVEDASKIAFATLLANLRHWRFDLVDCQAHTDHLERFGAVHWPRRQFLDVLKVCMKAPTRMGPWEIEVQPAAASTWEPAAKASSDG